MNTYRRPFKTRNRQLQSGTTLVEYVILSTAMMLVLSAVIPSFMGAASHRLDGTLAFVEDSSSDSDGGGTDKTIETGKCDPMRGPCSRK